jgi:hypothetical protein
MESLVYFVLYMVESHERESPVFFEKSDAEAYIRSILPGHEVWDVVLVTQTDVSCKIVSEEAIVPGETKGW